MKKKLILIIFLFSASIIFSAVTVKATVSARLSASTVSIDNKDIVFDAYEIDKQLYFKLRDVAYALSGTEKKFEIEWQKSTNAIKITSGKAYTPTGTEMAVTGKENKKSTKALVQIMCGRELHKLNSYLISGNYYFTLPDIAYVLNILLTNDGERYSINTKKTPALLSETDDKGQEYIDRIVFMGDSTTYGLLAYGVLTDGMQSTQVWVPSNKTFSLFNQKGILILYPETKENISVEKAVSLRKPEYMVITLGINGVSSMSGEDFKRHYKELIGRILETNPETKIMLNSIYPVAKNYGSPDKINNGKIDAANKWILELAEEINVRYLDTNSILKDDDGWLADNYQSGDGLHLTSTAYKTILKYIRTHAYR